MNVLTDLDWHACQKCGSSQQLVSVGAVSSRVHSCSLPLLPSLGEEGKGIQLFSDVPLYSMSSFNVG